MNIALPTLLILLLLLPGLFFVSGYYKFEPSAINLIPFTHKTTLSLFAALVLHLCFLALPASMGLTVNAEKLMEFLSNPQEDISISIAETKAVIKYLLLTSMVGFLLGILLRWLITTIFKLDKKFLGLRFNNEWFYFFKGYGYKDETIELVEIYALVETAGQSFLYYGILKDYFFDSDGNISTLIIRSAKRTLSGQFSSEITDNKLIPKECFHKIPQSHCFILKYSEIVNLNIYFITSD
ncbi:hypothetical protein ACQUW5_05505 [Legionella sp. CNM-1927-20]|uniref:hypothetical protein n=1 Tax=Legionella sp. CNM-1927-20 TaxID=3422221 RepID=UPI00403AC91D